jgi:hypothetical protein
MRALSQVVVSIGIDEPGVTVRMGTRDTIGGTLFVTSFRASR